VYSHTPRKVREDTERAAGHDGGPSFWAPRVPDSTAATVSPHTTRALIASSDAHTRRAADRWPSLCAERFSWVARALLVKQQVAVSGWFLKARGWSFRPHSDCPRGSSQTLPARYAKDGSTHGTRTRACGEPAGAEGYAVVLGGALGRSSAGHNACGRTETGIRPAKAAGRADELG
jgi:hypothetical protein